MPPRKKREGKFGQLFALSVRQLKSSSNNDQCSSKSNSPEQHQGTEKKTQRREDLRPSEGVLIERDRNRTPFGNIKENGAENIAKTKNCLELIDNESHFDGMEHGQASNEETQDKKFNVNQESKGNEGIDERKSKKRDMDTKKRNGQKLLGSRANIRKTNYTKSHNQKKHQFNKSHEELKDFHKCSPNVSPVQRRGMSTTKRSDVDKCLVSRHACTSHPSYVIPPRFLKQKEKVDMKIKTEHVEQSHAHQSEDRAGEMIYVNNIRNCDEDHQSDDWTEEIIYIDKINKCDMGFGHQSEDWTREMIYVDKIRKSDEDLDKQWMEETSETDMKEAEKCGRDNAWKGESSFDCDSKHKGSVQESFDKTRIAENEEWTVQILEVSQCCTDVNKSAQSLSPPHVGSQSSMAAVSKQNKDNYGEETYNKNHAEISPFSGNEEQNLIEHSAPNMTEIQDANRNINCKISSCITQTKDGVNSKLELIRDVPSGYVNSRLEQIRDVPSDFVNSRLDHNRKGDYVKKVILTNIQTEQVDNCIKTEKMKGIINDTLRDQMESEDWMSELMDIEKIIPFEENLQSENSDMSMEREQSEIILDLGSVYAVKETDMNKQKNNVIREEPELATEGLEAVCLMDTKTSDELLTKETFKTEFDLCLHITDELVNQGTTEEEENVGTAESYETKNTKEKSEETSGQLLTSGIKMASNEISSKTESSGISVKKESSELSIKTESVETYIDNKIIEECQNKSSELIQLKESVENDHIQNSETFGGTEQTAECDSSTERSSDPSHCVQTRKTVEEIPHNIQSSEITEHFRNSKTTKHMGNSGTAEHVNCSETFEAAESDKNGKKKTNEQVQRDGIGEITMHNPVIETETSHIQITETIEDSTIHDSAMEIVSEHIQIKETVEVNENLCAQTEKNAPIINKYIHATKVMEIIDQIKKMKETSNTCTLSPGIKKNQTHEVDVNKDSFLVENPKDFEQEANKNVPTECVQKECQEQSAEPKDENDTSTNVSMVTKLTSADSHQSLTEDGTVPPNNKIHVESLDIDESLLLIQESEQNMNQEKENESVVTVEVSKTNNITELVLNNVSGCKSVADEIVKSQECSHKSEATRKITLELQEKKLLSLPTSERIDNISESSDGEDQKTAYRNLIQRKVHAIGDQLKSKTPSSTKTRGQTHKQRGVNRTEQTDCHESPFELYLKTIKHFDRDTVQSEDFSGGFFEKEVHQSSLPWNQSIATSQKNEVTNINKTVKAEENVPVISKQNKTSQSYPKHGTQHDKELLSCLSYGKSANQTANTAIIKPFRKKHFQSRVFENSLQVSTSSDNKYQDKLTPQTESENCSKVKSITQRNDSQKSIEDNIKDAKLSQDCRNENWEESFFDEAYLESCASDKNTDTYTCMCTSHEEEDAEVPHSSRISPSHNQEDEQLVPKVNDTLVVINNYVESEDSCSSNLSPSQNTLSEIPSMSEFENSINNEEGKDGPPGGVDMNDDTESPAITKIPELTTYTNTKHYNQEQAQKQHRKPKTIPDVNTRPYPEKSREINLHPQETGTTLNRQYSENGRSQHCSCALYDVPENGRSQHCSCPLYDVQYWIWRSCLCSAPYLCSINCADSAVTTLTSNRTYSVYPLDHNNNFPSGVSSSKEDYVHPSVTCSCAKGSGKEDDVHHSVSCARGSSKEVIVQEDTAAASESLSECDAVLKKWKMTGFLTKTQPNAKSPNKHIKTPPGLKLATSSNDQTDKRYAMLENQKTMSSTSYSSDNVNQMQEKHYKRHEEQYIEDKHFKRASNRIHDCSSDGKESRGRCPADELEEQDQRRSGDPDVQLIEQDQRRSRDPDIQLIKQDQRRSRDPDVQPTEQDQRRSRVPENLLEHEYIRQRSSEQQNHRQSNILTTDHLLQKRHSMQKSSEQILPDKRGHTRSSEYIPVGQSEERDKRQRSGEHQSDRSRNMSSICNPDHQSDDIHSQRRSSESIPDSEDQDHKIKSSEGIPDPSNDLSLQQHHVFSKTPSCLGHQQERSGSKPHYPSQQQTSHSVLPPQYRVGRGYRRMFPQECSPHKPGYFVDSAYYSSDGWNSYPAASYTLKCQSCQADSQNYGSSCQNCQAVRSSHSSSHGGRTTENYTADHRGYLKDSYGYSSNGQRYGYTMKPPSYPTDGHGYAANSYGYPAVSHSYLADGHSYPTDGLSYSANGHSYPDYPFYDMATDGVYSPYKMFIRRMHELNVVPQGSSDEPWRREYYCESQQENSHHTKNNKTKLKHNEDNIKHCHNIESNTEIDFGIYDKDTSSSFDKSVTPIKCTELTDGVSQRGDVKSYSSEMQVSSEEPSKSNIYIPPHKRRLEGCLAAPSVFPRPRQYLSEGREFYNRVIPGHVGVTDCNDRFMYSSQTFDQKLLQKYSEDYDEEKGVLPSEVSAVEDQAVHKFYTGWDYYRYVQPPVPWEFSYLYQSYPWESSPFHSYEKAHSGLSNNESEKVLIKPQNGVCDLDLPTPTSSVESTPSSRPHRLRRFRSWRQLDTDSEGSSTDWKQNFKQRCSSYSTGYIDSHCHLDFLFNRLDFKGTWSDFQMENTDTFPNNFLGCIAVFCNPNSFRPDGLWKNLMDEENVWLTFGCHPKNARDFTAQHEEGLRRCLQATKAVALGEIGLDYSGMFNEYKVVQKAVFRRQINIALEMGKPLVIHCREAERDCLEILEEMVPRDYKIHCHCFTGNFISAELWLNMFPNLFIGLTPLVTFKSATGTHNVAKSIPLERLLLESDTPYFVPRTFPKDALQYSHPGMCITVAEEVAYLRQISVTEVLQSCRKNTKTMYGI